MKNMMLMCVVVGLLAGCDYTVPLVRTPDRAIDTAIVGLWQRTGADGKVEQLLVLPLSDVEYLVVFPAGSTDAMFARGSLWHGAALTLVQLDWFGTAQGKLPEDNRTFQYALYTVASEILTVRLLNPDVVAKDIASSDALAREIANNEGHSNLFRNEMVFQKANN
jgi:hypothetical protein